MSSNESQVIPEDYETQMKIFYPTEYAQLPIPHRNHYLQRFNQCRRADYQGNEAYLMNLLEGRFDEETQKLLYARCEYNPRDLYEKSQSEPTEFLIRLMNIRQFYAAERAYALKAKDYDAILTAIYNKIVLKIHRDDPAYARILWAAKTGQLTALQDIIKEHSAEEEHYKGAFERALVVACQTGQTEMIEVLLNHQVAVTPDCLLAACERGHLHLLQRLIAEYDQKKQSPQWVDIPLVEKACLFNRENVVLDLLRYPAIKRHLKEGEYKDLHPFLIACANGNLQLIKAFLKDGIRGESQKESPLHFAAAYGYLETLNVLLAQVPKFDLECKTNREGNTALHLACKNKRWGCALALIQAGANPLSTNNDGDTPLHMLSRHEDKAVMPVVEALFKKDSRVVRAVNRQKANHTPFAYACANGNQAFVSWYFTHVKKDNLSLQDAERNALRAAISEGHAGVVEEFVTRCTFDEWERAEFMGLIIKNGQADVLDVFLEKLNPPLDTEKLESALLQAAGAGGWMVYGNAPHYNRHSISRIIEKLLAHGAGQNIQVVKQALSKINDNSEAKKILTEFLSKQEQAEPLPVSLRVEAVVESEELLPPPPKPNPVVPPFVLPEDVKMVEVEGTDSTPPDTEEEQQPDARSQETEKWVRVPLPHEVVAQRRVSEEIETVVVNRNEVGVNFLNRVEEYNERHFSQDKSIAGIQKYNRIRAYIEALRAKIDELPHHEGIILNTPVIPGNPKSSLADALDVQRARVFKTETTKSYQRFFATTGDNLLQRAKKFLESEIKRLPDCDKKQYLSKIRDELNVHPPQSLKELCELKAEGTPCLLHVVAMHRKGKESKLNLQDMTLDEFEKMSKPKSYKRFMKQLYADKMMESQEIKEIINEGALRVQPAVEKH